MPHEVDILVGAKIRMVRNEQGLSQGELAAELGISFQQVQKYENGKNRISASRLVEVARIFDVPVSYIFADVAEQVGDGTENVLDPEFLSSLSTDSKTQKIVFKFNRIKDENVKNALMDLINTVSSD